MTDTANDNSNGNPNVPTREEWLAAWHSLLDLMTADALHGMWVCVAGGDIFDTSDMSGFVDPIDEAAMLEARVNDLVPGATMDDYRAANKRLVDLMERSPVLSDGFTEVCVSFFGPAGGAAEKVAVGICESHGGKLLGSGMFLPTSERDMQYAVPNDEVENVIEALKKAGQYQIVRVKEGFDLDDED